MHDRGRDHVSSEHHATINNPVHQGVVTMIRRDSLEHVEGRGWYVRTRRRHEGPFGTLHEATCYLSLLNRVSAAGLACSYLARDLDTGSTGLGFLNLRRRGV